MNSKERVKAAMSLKEPDRVPVECPLSEGHILTNMRKEGIDPVDFHFSPEARAESLIFLTKKYGFDGVRASLWYGGANDSDWRKRVRNIKSDEQGQWVYWKDGGSTLFKYDDWPEIFPKKKQPSIDEISVEQIENSL